MRTLRILTKPDLVDKGAEDKIIELVETCGREAGVSRIRLGVC
jgi:hypothetical protein